jgi:hypothetical protein
MLETPQFKMIVHQARSNFNKVFSELKHPNELENSHQKILGLQLLIPKLRPKSPPHHWLMKRRTKNGNKDTDNFLVTVGRHHKHPNS